MINYQSFKLPCTCERAFKLSTTGHILNTKYSSYLEIQNIQQTCILNKNHAKKLNACMSYIDHVHIRSMKMPEVTYTLEFILP